MKKRDDIHRALCASMLIAAGCRSAIAPPPVEQRIEAATGIEQAVVLAVEGGPTDVPSPDAAELALADAVRRALATSPELQASLARVRIALADAEQARLVANPLLDVIVRFPSGGGAAEIEAGLSQDLLSLLGRPRAVRAADLRLERAAWESVTAALDVAALVQERYASVQALDEIAPLLRERGRLLDRLTDVARARLELGEGTRLDVTTLEAQRSELDLDAAEREARRREERLALARAIGEPSGAAAWTLEAWRGASGALADEGPWIEAALERRPELAAHGAELRALEEDAAAAGLTLLEGTSAGVSAHREDGWSIGPEAALPVPVFDTGSARRARAAAAVVEARHGLTEARRSVVEEVRRAHAAARAAAESLGRVRDELIPLLVQRREQVERIYVAGQADVTALIVAEQDLQAAQERLVELEERAVVSRVRLARSVGGGGVEVERGLASAMEVER